MGWQQIIFNTNSSFAEILSDILWEIGAVSTSFVDNKDNPIFEPLPGETILWEETDLITLFDECVDPLQIIKILKEKYNIDNLKYQISYVKDKDWTKEWIQDYKPMKFGNRLWVCPSWDVVDGHKAVIVKLDPGLAFGTGTHNTTRLCLQYLDSIDLKNKIVIDYGCGSGILAIASILLGAKKAICIDIDPQALEAVAYNAENNNVQNKIEAYLANEIPEIIKQQQADLVIANILAGPLIELYPIIKELVNSNGLIALSGILKEKAINIKETYSKSFDLKTQIDDEDWCLIHGAKIL